MIKFVKKMTKNTIYSIHYLSFLLANCIVCAMFLLPNNLMNKRSVAQDLIAFVALVYAVIYLSLPTISQASAVNHAPLSITNADALTISSSNFNFTKTSKSLHALSNYSHIKKLSQQKSVVARSYRKKYAESTIILTAIDYSFSLSNLSNQYDESFYTTSLVAPLYSNSSPRGPPSNLKPNQA
jgi:hypothetical protein